MKILKVVLLAAAMSLSVFADDEFVAVAVPEAGLDGLTIASAIGLVTGGLLVVRARRK